MPRLSQKDEQLVAGIRERLSTMEIGGPSGLAVVMPDLQRLLKLDRALSYGIRTGSGTHELDFLHAAGWPLPSSVVKARVGEWVTASGARWGYFNPARPEQRQRNVPLAVPISPGDDPVVQAEKLWGRLGLAAEARSEARAAMERNLPVLRELGIAGAHQLRALVCDGESLLAWVGGFRDEPATAYESSLLGALIPALQSRLKLERDLTSMPVALAALEATLEQLGGAAYVVDRQGRVLHANACGRSALAQGRSGLREELRQAVQSGSEQSSYWVTGLEVAGLARHFLLSRRFCGSPGERLPRAGRHWGLTPRQQEVLGRLALGESNRTIAGHLDCSERTVELHITQLLHKAGVESRAALVAAFWTRFSS